MGDYLKIAVQLQSGKQVVFEDIVFSENYLLESDGILLKIGSEMPYPVEARPLDNSETITSLEFTFYTEIRNYHSVIVPDSGRWFFNSSKIVTFWRSFRELETGVDDTKLPLYIFTGRDRNTALAAGIIGENYETTYQLVEPESNRALNVHTGHIAFRIKRGTDQYPIPQRIAQQYDDRSVTEYVYYNQFAGSDHAQPWVMSIRDFSNYQRSLYLLQDVEVEASMLPIWCTWADWHSNDITSDIIVDNVKIGTELGIYNYIIDDGWFGPGLDNDYSVNLNIGDWEPDPHKIPDMVALVNDIKEHGGKPIIWCAPHAVAAGAKCYPERERLLIAEESGKPIINPTQFYSLCFMNEEARDTMADICVKFIEKWDFDGAKYDLFNWVPNVKCNNPNHHHDVTTMLEGLEMTLALIEERTRKLKPEYIVELKQNYGTPFFSRYGTMMRAGDGPFDPESNFLRTLFIQGYTPYALNDYQIIKGSETPEDTAVAIIKMLAAGIPAYSMDFKKLSVEQLDVIRLLNEWYIKHLNIFKQHRIPLDPDSAILKAEGPNFDIVFMVNGGGPIEIARDTIVVNGTYSSQLFVRSNCSEKLEQMTITVADCFGKEVDSQIYIAHAWNAVPMSVGGIVKITHI